MCTCKYSFCIDAKLPVCIHIYMYVIISLFLSSSNVDDTTLGILSNSEVNYLDEYAKCEGIGITEPASNGDVQSGLMFPSVNLSLGDNSGDSLHQKFSDMAIPDSTDISHFVHAAPQPTTLGITQSENGGDFDINTLQLVSTVNTVISSPSLNVPSMSTNTCTTVSSPMMMMMETSDTQQVNSGLVVNSYSLLQTGKIGTGSVTDVAGTPNISGQSLDLMSGRVIGQYVVDLLQNVPQGEVMMQIPVKMETGGTNNAPATYVLALTIDDPSTHLEQNPEPQRSSTPKEVYHSLDDLNATVVAGSIKVEKKIFPEKEKEVLTVPDIEIKRKKNARASRGKDCLVG